MDVRRWEGAIMTSTVCTVGVIQIYYASVVDTETMNASVIAMILGLCYTSVENH